MECYGSQPLYFDGHPDAPGFFYFGQQAIQQLEGLIRSTLGKPQPRQHRLLVFAQVGVKVLFALAQLGLVDVPQ